MAHFASGSNVVVEESAAALASALGGIEASKMSLNKKKKAKWIASSAFWTTLLKAGDPSVDPIVSCQSILEEVDGVLSCGCDLGQACLALKNYGLRGRELSKKLYKLGVARNVAAHPMVTLQRDIRALLAQDDGQAHCTAGNCKIGGAPTARKEAPLTLAALRDELYLFGSAMVQAIDSVVKSSHHHGALHTAQKVEGTNMWWPVPPPLTISRLRADAVDFEPVQPHIEVAQVLANSSSSSHGGMTLLSAPSSLGPCGVQASGVPCGKVDGQDGGSPHEGTASAAGVLVEELNVEAPCCGTTLDGAHSSHDPESDSESDQEPLDEEEADFFSGAVDVSVAVVSKDQEANEEWIMRLLEEQDRKLEQEWQQAQRKRGRRKKGGKKEKAQRKKKQVKVEEGTRAHDQEGENDEEGQKGGGAEVCEIKGQERQSVGEGECKQGVSKKNDRGLRGKGKEGTGGEGEGEGKAAGVKAEAERKDREGQGGDGGCGSCKNSSREPGGRSISTEEPPELKVLKSFLSKIPVLQGVDMEEIYKKTVDEVEAEKEQETNDRTGPQ